MSRKIIQNLFSFVFRLYFVCIDYDTIFLVQMPPAAPQATTEKCNAQPEELIGQ